MGHLYYIELGNIAGGGLINTGPFINLMHGEYWSGTEIGPEGADAFYMYNGFQVPSEFKMEHLFAFAVRDGDVVAVPEPSTLLLFGFGLIGFVFFAMEKFGQRQG